MVIIIIALRIIVSNTKKKNNSNSRIRFFHTGTAGTRQVYVGASCEPLSCRGDAHGIVIQLRAKESAGLHQMSRAAAFARPRTLHQSWPLRNAQGQKRLGLLFARAAASPWEGFCCRCLWPSESTWLLQGPSEKARRELPLTATAAGIHAAPERVRAQVLMLVFIVVFTIQVLHRLRTHHA